jgi:hypothetical protein
VPTKAKADMVTVSYTQEEAKQVALKLEKCRNIELSIGDQNEAAMTKLFRDRLVHASGKVAAP